jgi:hypothetical protein
MRPRSGYHTCPHPRTRLIRACAAGPSLGHASRPLSGLQPEWTTAGHVRHGRERAARPELDGGAHGVAAGEAEEAAAESVQRVHGLSLHISHHLANHLFAGRLEPSGAGWRPSPHPQAFLAAPVPAPAWPDPDRRSAGLRLAQARPFGLSLGQYGLRRIGLAVWPRANIQANRVPEGTTRSLRTLRGGRRPFEPQPCGSRAPSGRRSRASPGQPRRSARTTVGKAGVRGLSGPAICRAAAVRTREPRPGIPVSFRSRAGEAFFIQAPRRPMSVYRP